MGSQKTYTESEQIGEEGQTLAAAAVTRLGHIWENRRIDHGVDGQIELVDPMSRAASNIQVMVQSKAKDGDFPGETDESFHFLLTAADVTYWRQGDNKVIVICSKPRDNMAWWAPFERAEPPGRGRKSWKLTFDKVTDRLNEDSIGRLALWASDARPGRAISGRQRRAETIETNLVKIDAMPPQIFFGPSWKKTGKDLGPALRDRGYYRSDWIIRGGIVYTFTEPERDGLGSFMDGGYETIETEEWAESKDLDTISNLTELLRLALREQEHTMLSYHRKKRYFIFRSPPEGQDALRVKVASSKRGRTVVQRYVKDDAETKDFRHYAADIRFVHTDEGWAAELNPTYHFTFDGRRDLPWGADRLKGIKKLEKNPAVRGLVTFWAEFLARPQQLGEQDRPLRFGSRISFHVDVGINDSDWNPSTASHDQPDPNTSTQQELLS